MKTVSLRIRRALDGKESWNTWDVPVEDRTTVLDALFWVLRHRDRSLAFRCACRAAMCGSCAMMINGSERLACKTALDGLGKIVRVEPLRHLPVVKDLVVDMAPFFARYQRMKPAFSSDSSASAEPAIIPPGNPLREAIDDHLDCISCGACYSACPIVGMSGEYAGPAALLRAFNLLADEREDDPVTQERWEAVADRYGIWRCHGLGECSRVCPKNVDPSGAIRNLKRMLLLGTIG